jgi:hypothetical protein
VVSGWPQGTRRERRRVIAFAVVLLIAILAALVTIALQGGFDQLPQ